MTKSHCYEILILGAGASGLMAAAHLRDKKIAIIDGNAQIGEKIRISGGGRCNVTNERVLPSNYLGDPAFIEPSLEAFTNNDLLAYLADHGCRPEVRFLGQYFCNKSSEELLQVFRKLLTKVPLFLESTIESIEHSDVFRVRTSGGTFSANKIIVATGGLSYAKIGASDVGYEIAKSFGHSIVMPQPALVGLTLQPDEFWMKALSGITFPASVLVENRRFYGDLLFAHKGISGPIILNASVYWKKGLVSLDFLPEITLKDLLKPSKKQLSTLLPLPKRFCKALLDTLSVPDVSSDQLTPLQRQTLERVKSYTFAPAGTFGFSRAEVTRGGVNTDEINPWTMESLKQSDLYFVGEVLDVTGQLGGYNFQWAFSSAVLCARSLT